jgi:hypothetical protein
MGLRALIWAIIVTLLIMYLVIVNYNRLPEYGSGLASMWPFFFIVIGFLILFRRKGRPKHDFFFNNTKLAEKIEEVIKQQKQKTPNQQ